MVAWLSIATLLSKLIHLFSNEAKAKTLRPRPRCLEAEANYKAETEAEAKILVSRQVWPRGFNISVDLSDKLVGYSIVVPRGGGAHASRHCKCNICRIYYSWLHLMGNKVYIREHTFLPTPVVQKITKSKQYVHYTFPPPVEPRNFTLLSSDWLGYIGDSVYCRSPTFVVFDVKPLHVAVKCHFTCLYI